MVIPFPELETQQIALPQVTLCAVTSVNVEATIRALEASMDLVDFADCLLFTDAACELQCPKIRIVEIEALRSSRAYSNFILKDLVGHIETSHCLIAQWDGHVINAAHWDAAFLRYDYIGASWPQFPDDYKVGNGGFSLRSRRLMEACRSSGFHASHPEDVAICRINRAWLQSQGMRFAPKDLADSFSTERSGDLHRSFGYHGAFNMPKAVGNKAFWDIYRSLDDRGTIWHDFGSILNDIRRGPGGSSRMTKFLFDRMRFRQGRTPERERGCPPISPG